MGWDASRWLIIIPTIIGVDDHTLWVSKPSFDPWHNIYIYIYSTNRSILGFPTILFLPTSFMIFESKIVGHLNSWDLTFFCLVEFTGLVVDSFRFNMLTSLDVLYIYRYR